MSVRERVPWRLRAPVRRTRNALALLGLAARRLPRRRLLARTPPRRGETAVCYGYERMPGPDEVVYGGAVKFALLHRHLPNAPLDFNVLYLGSSFLPLDARMLLHVLRRRGGVLVWNQNGVAYPGWYGEGWELVNEPRARLLHEADHVVYQTEFCRRSADRFYGPRAGSWEILPNPVDTSAFTPAPGRPKRPLTLLLGGNQYQRYRLELALETLARLRRERPDARLVVAGALSFAPDAAAQAAASIRSLGLDGAVELAGAYTQAEAPDLVRRADVLLHTKVNDPCPTIVLEAMACGVPVAYAASGGVPELVGDEAGVGVPVEESWERDVLPEPDALAGAVLAVLDRLDDRAAAARERAVQHFDARHWVERHRELFGELRNGRPAGLS